MTKHIQWSPSLSKKMLTSSISKWRGNGNKCQIYMCNKYVQREITVTMVL